LAIQAFPRRQLPLPRIYGFKKRPEMGENDLYKQAGTKAFYLFRFALAADQGD